MRPEWEKCDQNVCLCILNKLEAVLFDFRGNLVNKELQ